MLLTSLSPIHLLGIFFLKKRNISSILADQKFSKGSHLLLRHPPVFSHHSLFKEKQNSCFWLEVLGLEARLGCNHILQIYECVIRKWKRVKRSKEKTLAVLPLSKYTCKWILSITWWPFTEQSKLICKVQEVLKACAVTPRFLSLLKEFLPPTTCYFCSLTLSSHALLQMYKLVACSKCQNHCHWFRSAILASWNLGKYQCLDLPHWGQRWKSCQGAQVDTLFWDNWYPP